MQKNLEPNQCIKGVPIFKNLSEEELDQIIMIAHHQKFDKGEFIHQAGDMIHRLYVIHQGKVKISRLSEDGKEQVIRLLSHGDFLGELALFSDTQVHTYAQTLEPTVICLVDHQQLKQLMSKSPTLSIKMMVELSQRLEKAEALIENSNLYSALAKVARFLLDIEKNDRATFHTTKVNIASTLGITPETLSRKLREISQTGYIEMINHKSVRITNKQGLIELIHQHG